MDDLVETWREELKPYSGKDIADALEALRGAHPDYPPTLFQFAGLCKAALARRSLDVPRIDHDPRTGPIDPTVATMIEKALTNRPPPRKWAERVLERAANGEPVGSYAVASAREVLGV